MPAKNKKTAPKPEAAPAVAGMPRFYILAGSQAEAMQMIQQFRLPPQEAIILRDVEMLKESDDGIIVLQGTGARRHSQYAAILSRLNILNASVWEERL